MVVVEVVVVMTVVVVLCSSCGIYICFDSSVVVMLTVVKVSNE